MKSTCISCKYYKIEDALSGYCRVESRESGDRSAHNPMVRQDDSCRKWLDCGQQYYIRLGWIKAMNAREKDMNTQ